MPRLGTSWIPHFLLLLGGRSGHGSPGLAFPNPTPSSFDPSKLHLFCTHVCPNNITLESSGCVFVSQFGCKPFGVKVQDRVAAGTSSPHAGLGTPNVFVG